MCEYCEGKKNVCDYAEDSRYPTFKSGIELSIDGNILIADCPREDYKEIEINFCPMCGRKL